MQDIITTTNMATKIVPMAPYALKKALTGMLVAFALVIGGFVSAGTADAATTNYFYDLTGNGCGNNCADFESFLVSKGINITTTVNGNSNGTPTNTTSKATTTQPAKTSTQYPYQIYTNFPSTDAYYKAMSATSSYNVQTYPYQVYTYFQDPGPKYDPYAAGTYQYPYQYYVYNNGTSASQQLSKYPQTYNPSYNYGTGYGAYPYNGYAGSYPTNTGFTMTSGQR